MEVGNITKTATFTSDFGRLHKIINCTFPSINDDTIKYKQFMPVLIGFINSVIAIPTLN